MLKIKIKVFEAITMVISFFKRNIKAIRSIKFYTSSLYYKAGKKFLTVIRLQKHLRICLNCCQRIIHVHLILDLFVNSKGQLYGEIHPGLKFQHT